jgi:hypothetical protein
MNKILLLLLWIFLIDCKGSPAQFSSEQKSHVNQILEANQLVHDQLLANQDLPAVTPLLDAFRSASKSIQREEISNSILLLEKIDTTNPDAYIETLSKVSENTASLAQMSQISGYNKFYCPMVNKYWVSKGEKIENPYAAEMRDCGEIVE